MSACLSDAVSGTLRYCGDRRYLLVEVAIGQGHNVRAARVEGLPPVATAACKTAAMPSDPSTLGHLNPIDSMRLQYMVPPHTSCRKKIRRCPPTSSLQRLRLFLIIHMTRG